MEILIQDFKDVQKYSEKNNVQQDKVMIQKVESKKKNLKRLKKNTDDASTKDSFNSSPEKIKQPDLKRQKVSEN